MRPRMEFWCKCRDAFQAAWERTMREAREESYARTNKLTKFFSAVESDYYEDAPDWRVTGGVR